MTKTKCKQIQREARAIDRARKSAKIGRILDEYKNIKEIAAIRRNGKTDHIGSIQAADGSIKRERKDIADVFADFFEDLYRDRHGDTTPSSPSPARRTAHTQSVQTWPEIGAPSPKAAENRCIAL